VFFLTGPDPLDSQELCLGTDLGLGGNTVSADSIRLRREMQYELYKMFTTFHVRIVTLIDTYKLLTETEGKAASVIH
jgi:hypothetical protein